MSKKLTLCARRKSKRRFFLKLRRERQRKAEAEKAEKASQNTENIENATNNIHNDNNIQISVNSNVESKVDNEILPDQVEEEKVADYEKLTEAYEEESIYNENIANCKDKDNLVMDNECVLDNEERVEVYEENKEHEEEENTYIENCEDLEDLIIDNNSLSDRINNIPKNIPEGRCIVDFSFMWNELHRTFDDHARGIECQFKYWQLVNFRHCGLLTQLFFKCQMCNYEANFWTEPKDSKNNINVAAATACIKVGIGYTQMETLFKCMNIKFMSEKTYIKNRNVTS
ncbi:uncharacterized protein LOC114935252 [Nylanderia fulva]|uniref:uncharacterized protein LOC114935252 n=1 Tax=Nylanderia fulva TaxID=613905 RepID=UPI0010FB8A57|nr:uncharacterized protein LOC114935252 [Nylanderia fulva]XP_029163847.1 uncharacterized protein LOC114935252 [Nylanderia fulva]XP_029163848.1 uncharacterized protein LOC114935252 [Nylanderia fulva]